MCSRKLLIFFFILVSVVNCIHGYRRGKLERYGPVNFFLNSPVLKCYHGRTLKPDVGGITVYFYDFTNDYSNSFPIEDAANNILNYENLNTNRKFVMYVGGFNADEQGTEKIRQAYATYPDSYLIIPDHSPYTNRKTGMVRGYQRAVTYSYSIGKVLGNMLAEMKEGGISPQNVHCVGYSLGGQILGHIGETYYDLTGEKISRLTALDPAGPCFSDSSIQNQVRAEVAEYVEVFHCNSGGLGSSRFLGHVDYIVNRNGETQPICNPSHIPDIIFSSEAAICSHRVCLDLWAATVRNKRLFRAYSNYSEFNRKIRGRQFLSDKTTAGAWGSATAKGIYYIKVSSYDLSDSWW